MSAASARSAVNATTAKSPASKKLFLWPDTHVPFQSVSAVNAALAVVRGWQPDILVILGDFADMWSVSSHSRDPKRKLLLEDELHEVRAGLREIEKASAGARRIYVMGNHEHRLERYIHDRAPELAGLRGSSYAELVGLAVGGWEVVPYMMHKLIGKLYVTHDCGYAGANAVRATGQAYGSNVAIGHTHRLGVSYFGDARGNTYVSGSFGWLGDAAAIGYGHEASKARDWQLGFGTGRLLANGNVHLSPVPIVQGRAVVEGVSYGK